MQLEHSDYEDNKKWESLDELKNGENNPRKKLIRTLSGIGITTFLIILLVIIIIVISKSKANNKRVIWDSPSLPLYAKPLHYDITLSIDPIKKVFNGEETIEMILNNKTNLIILHSDNKLVRFARMRVTNDPKNTSPIFTLAESITYVENMGNKFVILRFDEITKASIKPPYNIQLRISFSGKIREDLQGLYSSTYYQNGKIEYVAATQFEPTGARYLFPCFDEPSYKSTFTLKVLTSREFTTVLSNMPQRSQTINQDTNQTSVLFEKTPVMSTYLLSVVVCKYDYVEDTSSSIPIRVYTSPDKLKFANYSANFAAKVVTYFNDYLGIKYPLPKLDLISIFQFKFGAMENWGLITSRENYLLYDPKYDTSLNKMRLAQVVAHEIAHQWFGNLVTTEWWSTIWLNEGFANFFEFSGVNAAEPSWNIWDIFYQDVQKPVLITDSSYLSHPLVRKVSSVDEIESVFDDITYSKGASLLRMLSNQISLASPNPNSFRDAIRTYLNKFLYSNANTEDFFAVISENTGIPFSTTYEKWVYDAGYPIISFSPANKKTDQHQRSDFSHVSPHSNPNNEHPHHSSSHNGHHDSHNQFFKHTTHHKDHQHFVHPNFKTKGKRDQIYHESEKKAMTQIISTQNKFLQENQKTITVNWNIPLYVQYSNSSSPSVSVSFDQTKNSQPFNYSSSTNDYFVANPLRMGFYRVYYNADMLSNFKKVLTEKDVNAYHAVDLGALFNDIYSITRSSDPSFLISPEFLLDLFYLSRNSTSYVLWYNVLDILNSISGFIRNEGDLVFFKNYVGKVLEKVYSHVSFFPSTEEPFTDKLLRNLLLPYAVRYNVSDAASVSLNLFRTFIQGSSNLTIDVDIRDALYLSAVLYGSESDWQWVLRDYKTTTSTTESKRCILALAESTSDSYLVELLPMASNNEIKDSEIIAFLSVISRSHKNLVWDYLVENWTVLSKNYGSSILIPVIKNFVDQTQISSFNSFADKVSLNATSLSFVNVLSYAKLNVYWTTNYYNVIVNYFKKY